MSEWIQRYLELKEEVDNIGHMLFEEVIEEVMEEVIDKRECIVGLTMGAGQCLNKGELLKS